MISRKGATTDLYLEMNAREGAYPDLDLHLGLRVILEMRSRGATTDLYLEMNAREGAYPDLAILKMSAREGGATAVGLRDILEMSGRVPDLGLPVVPDLDLEMSAREGGATAVGLRGILEMSGRVPDLGLPVVPDLDLEMSAREGGATAVGLRGILEMSGRVPDLGLPVVPDLDLERVTKGRRSVEVHSLRSGVLRECKSSSRRAMSVFLYGEISQSVVYAELTCWT